MKISVCCFLLGSLSAIWKAKSAEPERTPNIAPKDVREMLFLENEEVRLGIDQLMGGAITHLSWKGHQKNAVNIHDPGRLVQQSYYSGRRLDRTADGQSKNWSPWTWNPIQGGGVSSWARVTESMILDEGSLYAETIPKLWDMANEEADALMQQWTGWEPAVENVIIVRCQLICRREPNDRWGPAVRRHQEVPALYFTRNFGQFRSYLGKGEWRDETQAPGPPWGKATPPQNVMACFDSEGQGIAVFSPTATEHWNFGPHGAGKSSDSLAAPCVHMAPISTVSLGPDSTLSYRYWIVTGDMATISKRLNALLKKYSGERLVLDP